MKFLKQTFKTITLISFLFLSNCKKNETNNNEALIPTADTVSVLPSKITTQKDSIETLNENKECFKKSELELPYNQKIDVRKINYETCECKIEGIDELLCDSPNLRYIALPNFENRKVILIPMECGDFNYRFYMATIFENKLLDKLYVEGEWYEPGDETYKELTHFSIDKNYKITITKKNLDNEKITATELTEYQIDSSGNFFKSK